MTSTLVSTPSLYFYGIIKNTHSTQAVFSLEGKAKLFLRGFKHTVPGECKFSTLYAQTTKLPAPALITWSSES